MSPRKLLIAAAALVIVATLGHDLRAQQAPASHAQKRQDAMVVQQSLDRLQETKKTLQNAIEKLSGDSETKTSQAASNASPQLPGVNVQSAAIQQAEQALLDVRRAIDELDVSQERRQEVLDRLDDADSAMRMARQPDASGERTRLREALMKVQQEIEIAQRTLPDAPSAGER